jgi:hypothetical protein
LLQALLLLLLLQLQVPERQLLMLLQKLKDLAKEAEGGRKKYVLLHLE